MTEKIFANGVYYNNPSEKSPEFIKFYEDNKENGKLRLTALMSKKTGKPYLEVDKWKPLVKPEGLKTDEEKRKALTESEISYPKDEINVDEVANEWADTPF